GDVSVFLGNGDGTFRALPEQFAVGMEPAALVVADFNRDGKLDLATADSGSGDVSVLLGLGDGRFQETRRLTVGEAPTALAAGDFDRDGRPDLLVAHRGPAGSDGQPTWEISALLGNGDGTFRPAGEAQPVLSTPVALVTGQFSDDNGDGTTDAKDF